MPLRAVNDVFMYLKFSVVYTRHCCHLQAHPTVQIRFAKIKDVRLYVRVDAACAHISTYIDSVQQRLR